MDSPITIDLESDEPQSELVWYLAWETDNLGAGADAERVYKLDGKYYYCSSWGEDFGSFDSLQKTLLDNELIKVFPTAVSISCPELSAEEIAKMLVPDELSYGHELSINDEVWVLCDPGVFRMKQH